MHRNQGPVYYGEYLKLDQLLDSQQPLSKKYGEECHDETLFIIVHQVYELWFKQILHEINSINQVFSCSKIEESELFNVNSRLDRVIKIQSLLLDQLSVMETMTPMDFLEFRDLLIPASGFQSTQFRQIEVALGLKTDNREKVDREYFLGRLSKRDQEIVLAQEAAPSILENMQKWLERIPFTSSNHFNFWSEYQKCVEEMLKAEKSIIESNNAHLDEKNLEIQLENLKQTQKTFESLLKPEEHQELIKKGKRRLSHSATLNALFILLYRHTPLLTAPYQFLNKLMDIDENFTTWRYRHALMAKRMLGTKIGTGGSSGHQYLKMAAENNSVFTDLFNLSTFLIPRSKLPDLPEQIKKNLDFHFSGGQGNV